MIFFIYFHHHLPTHLRARAYYFRLTEQFAMVLGKEVHGYAPVAHYSTLLQHITTHTQTHSHKHIHLYAFIDAHTFTAGILKICHWLLRLRPNSPTLRCVASCSV